MALDRKCTNLYYLTGRLVAVVERSNNKMLSASQKDNILQNPSLYVNRYDEHKDNMMAEKNEIYNLMPAEGLPQKMGLEDMGRFWIGYHHQSYAMPEIEVEVHTPNRVEPVADNVIKSLKR